MIKVLVNGPENSAQAGKSGLLLERHKARDIYPHYTSGHPRKLKRLNPDEEFATVQLDSEETPRMFRVADLVEDR